MWKYLSAITFLLFILSAYISGNYIFNKKKASTFNKDEFCFDTDGGVNIFEKGVIEGQKNFSGKSPVDYCINYGGGPNNMVEYTCENPGGYSISPAGNFYSTSIQCEKGCIDGACAQ